MTHRQIKNVISLGLFFSEQLIFFSYWSSTQLNLNAYIYTLKDMDGNAINRLSCESSNSILRDKLISNIDSQHT